VGVLAHTRQRIQATDTGRLLLVGLPQGLRRLLERTGLLPRFELRDSTDQAVADLRSLA
jgi:anti-sigma B factor antagonist